MGNEFFRTNKQGLIECVDGDSGEVISVQSTRVVSHRLEKDALMKYTKSDGSVVYLDKSLSYDTVVSDQLNNIPFSEVLADLICQEIIEGKTITKVAKDPRFPNFYTLQKWRQLHPSFDAAIHHAFSARADHQHDRMLEEAEGISTKDEATVKKPLIDALKWSAEKTNPDQYGQKTKISGDPAAPLQLIIDTGIAAPESLPERSVEEISNSSNNEALSESGGIEESVNTKADIQDS